MFRNTIQEEETDRKETSEDLAVYDTLRVLLQPYQSTTKESESDKHFSTQEIINALEQHYGVLQGDPECGGIVNGEKIIEWMTKLGYTYANIGDLQLVWLMKKK
jgi:hypothetical protein